ncbi:FadR/GntR family transcriptional regulator [Egicoccus sp. AB-alg2]|uniref:FadR/GntR family transcriptional regulator n=1 Tax=Egicoccus sp. AB-alg2 TaxID=3242693 RepID=UPI00359E2E9C
MVRAPRGADGARHAPSTAPRTALYERVADWLLAYVAERGLAVGDRLPTERALAERFDVSRASVREALAALQAQGVLEIRHGDGIYLRHRPEERLALEALLVKRRRLSEVIEARSVLEVTLAGMAARRRTHADIRRIWLALDLMDADIAAGGIGAEGDRHFHAAVTAAARNPLLAELMNYLAGLIHESRIASLSQPGRPPRSSRQHRAIASAIEAGDPHEARAAMQAHIDLVGNLG